jgi:hypothetical protein
MSRHKNLTVGASPASPTAVIVEDQPEITPTEEEIARLAYSFWEERGSTNGSPEDDWFRAERELKTKTPPEK